MSRVTVACIQPPCLDETSLESQSDMLEVGMNLLSEALEKGPAFCCLPEFFNVFGAPADRYRALAENNAEGVRARVSALAQAHSSHIVLPLLERNGAAFYNLAYLIGPEDDTIRHYEGIALAHIEAPFAWQR